MNEQFSSVIFWEGNKGKNTLIPDGQVQFITNLNSADKDLNTKAIVFTHPAWARYFSTWMDLNAALVALLESDDTGKAHVSAIVDDIYIPMTTQKPVIWILDSSTIALWWWLEMLLACDYLIMSSQVKLWLPEMRFWFMPGAGGIPQGIQMFGRENTEKLLLWWEKLPMVPLSDLNHRLFDPERVFVSKTWQTAQDILKELSEKKLTKRVKDFSYIPITMSQELSDKCVDPVQRESLDGFLQDIHTHDSFDKLRTAELELVLTLLCRDEAKNRLCDFATKK